AFIACSRPMNFMILEKRKRAVVGFLQYAMPFGTEFTVKWMSSRIEWTLVLAGFCLLLLQFFMIRELTALLRGTEVVILLVTLAYFSGYSVGYGIAGRLSQEHVKKLAIVAWLVHLTLPFSFRYVGGLIIPKAAGV